LFRTTDIHNVYTDGLRTLLLKSKCAILIDTYSNALLPGANVIYIHYPLEGSIPQIATEKNASRKLKNTFYLAYLSYAKSSSKKYRRLVFGNSGYTLSAIRKYGDVNPKLLYPPIQREFFNTKSFRDRSNLVVSVARMSPNKNLSLIPYIASLTDQQIRFLIIGINESQDELNRILGMIDRFKVSDRVTVMTNVARGKLLDILRDSKVYLHLTHDEHFGVSIVEAMASGCIPVVHNSGGPVEFVPDSQRFNNWHEAARKIEKATIEWSPTIADQFTKYAQKFSEERFSEEFLKMFNSYVENLDANRSSN